MKSRLTVLLGTALVVGFVVAMAVGLGRLPSSGIGPVVQAVERCRAHGQSLPEINSIVCTFPVPRSPLPPSVQRSGSKGTDFMCKGILIHVPPRTAFICLNAPKQNGPVFAPPPSPPGP
jgi:hypothetical protein